MHKYLHPNELPETNSNSEIGFVDSSSSERENEDGVFEYDFGEKPPQC